MSSTIPAGSLVIMLHGVGSNGKNMLALADLWRASLPDAVFVAPDAPFAFDQADGRQWFSVTGVTDDNRASRIIAARPDFDRVIDLELEKHGFIGRLDRVALVGFSQGSMMLLDAIATGRFPVAAAVAFAGRLATGLPFAPAPQTRLLLLHGSNDTVVPPFELDRARAALQPSGFDVQGQLMPGVGHAITPDAGALAAEFIAAALTEEAVT